MCRMLIALGDIDPNTLLDNMILMAQDQTTHHELNQKKGLGSWKHSDGWGVAYLQKSSWKIVKSTKAIYQDKTIDSLRSVKSKAMLIHVRSMIGSDLSVHNTHPFQEEKFVFCHNGFIDEKISYDPRYKLKGKTDSEQLFYSILTNLNKKDLAASVRNTLLQYKKLTGTNIILASPQQTIVAVRENNYPTYYTMHIGKGRNALIISSEKIPSIKHMSWKLLSQGEVAVINNKERSVSIMKPQQLVPVETKIHA